MKSSVKGLSCKQCSSASQVLPHGYYSSDEGYKALTMCQAPEIETREKQQTWPLHLWSRGLMGETVAESLVSWHHPPTLLYSYPFSWQATVNRTWQRCERHNPSVTFCHVRLLSQVKTKMVNERDSQGPWSKQWCNKDHELNTENVLAIS